MLQQKIYAVKNHALFANINEKFLYSMISASQSLIELTERTRIKH